MSSVLRSVRKRKSPDFRFGYGTLTHPSSRHALIVAGSA